MTPGDQDSLAAEHPDDTVASFEEEGNHFSNQVRNWLHQTPAAVPLIVLVISTIVFGLVLGSKFFSPFALTLILQQVAIVGIVALAQSLVILTAGIDLSVGAIMVFSSVIMGQFTFFRSASRGFGILRPVRWHPHGSDQWDLGSHCAFTTIYCHSRYLADFSRGKLFIF